MSVEIDMALKKTLCMGCGAFYATSKVFSYSKNNSDEFTICPVCSHHTLISEKLF